MKKKLVSINNIVIIINVLLVNLCKVVILLVSHNVIISDSKYTSS